MPLTDKSPFPCGRDHKGTPMRQVPPRYLLWCADQPWANSPTWKPVKEYVEHNRAALEMEIETHCQELVHRERPNQSDPTRVRIYHETAAAKRGAAARRASRSKIEQVCFEVAGGLNSEDCDIETLREIVCALTDLNPRQELPEPEIVMAEDELPF